MSGGIGVVIDHVVVNVRDRLDEAQRRWERLGFRLTPRGHHSLGSSNHLAVFGQDYIELLGIEPGRSATRRELIDHPLGLTGLALKPADDGFVDALRARGVRVGEAREFHRPVDLGGEQGVGGDAPDARFRTAELAEGLVRNGRVFFCHHYTPELVWRDAWRGHPNGAVGLSEFVFRSSDPAGLAAVFGRLGGAPALAPGGFAVAAGPAVITILAPDAATARFGAAASTREGDGMIALGVRVRDVAAAAGMAGVGERDGNALVPGEAASGVALQYVRAE